ncbi:hypothetical protein EYV94_04510 [Puteibacter caeruleilacunae]|nr:hypothetical protein EYV94_04510 [Puteibacter caeruleilacunae]
MKRIIMVRHAKAEEHGWHKSDYERKLRPRGRKDAKRIAEALIKNHGIIPDHMITSPATRALETAEIFADVMNFPRVSIQKEIDLYDGMSTREFYQLIEANDESIRTVLVFGHNPSIYLFTHSLLQGFYGDMPTCSVVSITYEMDDWNDLPLVAGEMEFHEYPKLFKLA